MTRLKAEGSEPARQRGAAPTGKAPTTRSPVRNAEEGRKPLKKHWRVGFLAALAETSNVTAACTASGTTPSHAYRARREEPAFARAWRNALYEGYENLELEVLHRLRSGEQDRKYDNASAIRLLAAHRETIARERARRDNSDEQEVLDSIDAMIDEMRVKAAANSALAADAPHQADRGPDPEAGADDDA